ncbi:GDP-mannose 4,6-dehydratase, partial [Candidatus Fermentibacterales bacterium]|nr:GDP-mannose 4,6-dehydratase [Candidatus Fermentibacterales bacterium]
ECVQVSSVVMHFAAAVGVEQIIRRPIDTIEINVRGTENVLRAASRKTRRVFIASTSEVYGKSQAAPFREDGDIVLGATSRSRWSYACSKAMDEFLALAYSKARGLDIVIGRLFNTVGPRQTGEYGMVLPRFVDQALSGDPITVYGDGTQTRCFSLVGEVVECIRALMANPASAGMAVNIGSTEEITILELARTVKRITGSSSGIRVIPYEEAYPTDFEDMQRRVPDVSRLLQLTGKAPGARIEEIVRAVVDWRRSV